MGLDVLDNIKVLHISEPITPTELFARAGKLAIDSGWAREGFIQALTEREARYPTGLHTAGVEVAIPHADPEWTLQPGMVVCIANPPVPFQPMGGLGGEVQDGWQLLSLQPRSAVVSGKIAAACMIGLTTLLLTLLAFKFSAQLSPTVGRRTATSEIGRPLNSMG